MYTEMGNKFRSEKQKVAKEDMVRYVRVRVYRNKST